MKSLFMIYADFESILLPEDNEKQNPDESYTNKYQKHVGCSYGYKLIYVDDKFSKPFKSYLGKDAVYNLINTITEEIKYCSHVIKKHFNKELVIIKKDDEHFENSIKCWICDNGYDDGDVKVKDHCHITGKYRGSAHRSYNIKVKLNHIIPVIFHNLKNYDSHLIVQEVGIFDFEINIILNELEKYTSFNINNKLIFIDTYQLLSSSSDTVIRNLSKDDFKYLSQEFDSKVVLDLVNHKEFYPHEYRTGFEKLASKEKFYIC